MCCTANFLDHPNCHTNVSHHVHDVAFSRLDAGVSFCYRAGVTFWVFVLRANCVFAVAFLEINATWPLHIDISCKEYKKVARCLPKSCGLFLELLFATTEESSVLFVKLFSFVSLLSSGSSSLIVFLAACCSTRVAEAAVNQRKGAPNWCSEHDWWWSRDRVRHRARKLQSRPQSGWAINWGTGSSTRLRASKIARDSHQTMATELDGTTMNVGTVQ